MIQTCPNRIDCESALLTNYSSEGAEPFPPYYSVVFPNPENPIDRQWQMAGCVYVCVSYVSQQEADLCALRQSVLCTNPPGEEVWYSAEATCCSPCPGGEGEYCYTVPAGMFIAKTFAEAEAQAQAYACQQAINTQVCFNNPNCPDCIPVPPPPNPPNQPPNPPVTPNSTLGNLPRCACLGVHYSGSIEANGSVGVESWAVVGNIPPGLTFVGVGTGAIIVGTPTVSGTYSFQVIAYQIGGSYSTRIFTIQVLEVTTTALPNFVIGTPYSYQLAAFGGSGNYTWSVATGTLPDGLDLSQTGLISGTPTAFATGGTLTFEVRDITCENAERITLTPRVALDAVSTTTVKTERGFREYTTVLDTGTLYKRVDYAGSMEQIAFPNFNSDPAVDATQCGGMQLIYSGYDQIDNSGNILFRHRKDMMVMCAASQPSLFEADADTSLITPIYSPPALYGYCWPDDPDSCSTCDTDEINWSLLRDDATFGAIDYPNNMVWNESNVSKTDTLLTYAGNANLTGGVILNPTTQGFPINTGNNTYAQAFPFVRLSSSGGFSATLSEPYTDADAEATKVVYTGTSKTAENHPNYQITGANNFITRRSRTTDVAFTITCTRLIVGRDYQVTYELFTSAGVETEVEIDFTADDTTHVINGIVPPPDLNANITVRNARIRYA